MRILQFYRRALAARAKGLKSRRPAADLLVMFEWKDDYSVHVISVDAQHQNLFRLAGELHTAMATGQARAVLAKTLDRLVQYTAMHFAHEERLMRTYNYPDLAAHRVEHEALTSQVLKFQADFQNGRTTLTISLLQFLKNWLEKHIMGSDMKYAPFVGHTQ